MATEDIRLQCSIKTHLKTYKLMKRLRDKGFRCLIFLWLEARTNRPDGRLTGWDMEDIATAAGWDKDPRKFVEALLDTGWLDIEGETYVLHDWEEHQPWAANSEKRRANARKGAEKRWRTETPPKQIPDLSQIEPYWTQEDRNANSIEEQCESHADSNAPSPLPSPPIPCLPVEDRSDSGPCEEPKTPPPPDDDSTKFLRKRIARALNGRESMIQDNPLALMEWLSIPGEPVRVLGLILRAAAFPEAKIKTTRAGLLVALLVGYDELTDDESRESKKLLYGDQAAQPDQRDPGVDSFEDKRQADIRRLKEQS